MSNLTDFFGGSTGGGGGQVPLLSLLAFPYATPPKVVHDGQVFLRTGYSEALDFDPSLQSWVDQNIMFTSTHTEQADTANFIRSDSVDTDGLGKWMVGGWQSASGNTLPRIYYSEDDAISWVALPFSNFPSGWTVGKIRSGGNSVWIVQLVASNNVRYYRTTNDGQTWTDITLVIFPGGGVLNDQAFETNRLGVWFVISQSSTTCQRSTDNGASWASRSLGHQASDVKFGGGTWVVLLGNAQNSPYLHTHYAISTNDGGSWSGANPKSFSSLAYVQNQWIAWTGLGQRLDHVSNDFLTWKQVLPTYRETFKDSFAAADSKNELFAGLDGGLWLKLSRDTFRSSDKGLTWTAYDFMVGQVASGPNKRSVCVYNGNTLSNTDLPAGIWTGRPAAGLATSLAQATVPVYTSGTADTRQRLVMYMRIK